MRSMRYVKMGVCLLLLCGIMLAMTACSTKLNGTYRSSGLISQTVTFDRDGTVTMSAFGLDISGKYVIKGNTLTITYSAFGISLDFDSTFSKKGNTITINDVEFTKQ